MTGLDGNAVGGLLHVIFGQETTAAMARCAHCGAAWRMAEARVYQGAGTVLRCPRCDEVIMVIVERGAVASVDAQGLADLDWHA